MSEVIFPPHCFVPLLDFLPVSRSSARRGPVCFDVFPPFLPFVTHYLP